jgi:mono/diheme cytochrome c family protein
MNRSVKWAGIALGGVVGVLVLALAAVYGASEYRMSRHFDVPAAALALHDDPATLARGKHLVETRGCTDCHGANLGGTKFIDDPAMGTIFAANLTPGRGGAGTRLRTAEDWERAIRHGIKPDGKPLLVMPSDEFDEISDDDVAAMISYLRTLPPVDNEPASPRVGPLARVLYLAGKVPLIPAEAIDHSVRSRTAPPAGPTAEYGAYVAKGCAGCHGPSFSGGEIPGMPPGTPPAQNLTPDRTTGLGGWTEADFVRALREGRRPDGTELKPPMPWRITAQLDDVEIRALWAYLRTVPAKPAGGR